MATFSYIAQREEAIIELLEALKIEVKANSDTNTVNPENYDVWGTTMVNAKCLVIELEKHVNASRRYR